MNLNSLDLNKLRTLVTVVDAGGISAAARDLGLTRSAVSQSVASLERALGVPLFDRIGRRVVPTREGRALADRVRELNSQLAETLDEVENRDGIVRGRLRLGVYVGVVRDRLAPVLAEFLRAHPLAQIQVRHASLTELRAMLGDNRIDFALGLVQSPSAGERIDSTLLYRQELVLVSRERMRSAVTLDEVGELDFVDYYRSPPLLERWVRHHFPRRSVPRVRVRAWAHDTELVLQLVRAGVGAAVVPRAVAESALGSRELHVVRTSRPALVDPVFLDEARGLYRGPALTAFREALIDGLGGARA